MPEFLGGTTTIAGHAWRRALEIAADSYPDAYAGLFGAMTRGASLDLWRNDTGDGYLASIRECPGQFRDVLAALAKDRQDYEVADGQRLADLVFRKQCSEDYGRSLAEGFGVAAFDDELTSLRAAELARLASMARRGRRYPWSRKRP